MQCLLRNSRKEQLLLLQDNWVSSTCCTGSIKCIHRQQTTNFLYLSHVTCEFYRLKHFRSFYRPLHTCTVLKLHGWNRIEFNVIFLVMRWDNIPVDLRLLTDLSSFSKKDMNQCRKLWNEKWHENQSIWWKFSPIITIKVGRSSVKHNNGKIKHIML